MKKRTKRIANLKRKWRQNWFYDNREEEAAKVRWVEKEEDFPRPFTWAKVGSTGQRMINRAQCLGNRTAVFTPLGLAIRKW